MLHPIYYRHIYKDGLPKFIRFAENVWNIPRDDMSDEELAKSGVESLARFITEIGLPTTLTELGITDEALLKRGGGFL